MPNVVINNWFTGELVDTADMKIINNEIIQSLYSDFGGLAGATGCTPTITSSTQFSISGGAVFFGETNDATYISRTGTNLQFAIIPAQAGLSLVSPNCSIVITPVVAYSPDNRTTTITGVVSSKVTPASTDYVLATVASGAITAINSISVTTPSTTQRGYAQYATNEQAITGTATNLATTASNVKAVIENLKASSNTWTGVNTFNNSARINAPGQQDFFVAKNSVDNYGFYFNSITSELGGRINYYGGEGVPGCVLGFGKDGYLYNGIVSQGSDFRLLRASDVIVTEVYLTKATGLYYWTGDFGLSGFSPISAVLGRVFNVGVTTESFMQSSTILRSYFSCNVTVKDQNASAVTVYIAWRKS